MRLKVKSPSATQVFLIDDNASYQQLIAELELNKDLFPHQETVSAVKKGFPPTALEIVSDKLIREDIKSGDQLILETAGKSHSANPQADTSTSNDSKGSGDVNSKTDDEEDDIPHVNIPELHQTLILRNVPDDNSCMFNAINYAMKKESVKELRSICGTVVKSDPDKYNELVLGKTNQEYSKWIQQPNSWGGAIELGILSAYLNVRINCIDIELGNFITFENEAHKPTRFMNLIYSGIHYDLLALNSSKLSSKETDETMWELLSDKADLILSYSEVLCKLLQTKNYTTNTTTFRVRCLVCYKVLVGEMGASKHANETGHFNFGEV